MAIVPYPQRTWLRERSENTLTVLWSRIVMAKNDKKNI